MRGLLAYATYLPRYRLQRSELAEALGTPAGNGARVVASYDEDSTTMGVEAARRALTGLGGDDDGATVSPSSIHFATTSPAYMDKTNASAIHAALDLGPSGFAVDMAGSARSAVGALRAAAAGQHSGGVGGNRSGTTLAVLSDLRTGRPGSADERDGGDAAAAFVFGDGTDGALPIAEIVGEASCTAEFLDRWRLPGENASRTWEERFGLARYLPLIKDAGARALQAAGLEQADRVVVSSSHSRAAAAAAKTFAPRIETEQAAAGYSGAADLGIRLATALDEARPGETILAICAADGCDATVYRTTEAISRARARARDTVAEQLNGGRDVGYVTLLSWRGMLAREAPRRPEPDRPAGPPSARAEAWKFGFVGSRCLQCGRVHLPPNRVCSGCRSVDRMEREPMAARAGTVATYTVDRLAYSPSPPMIDVVVDFDGGGRCTVELTDASPVEVEIGTRVEMTFRLLYTTGGVHNYFWKARPANGK